jgi:outer membrane receptor protein involved in Fe transport
LVGYWIEVHDDIFNVVDEVTPTRGFFTNLDRTRRVGLEASVAGRPLGAAPGLSVTGSFGWTRATFQSHASLASPLVEDSVPPGGPPPDEGPTEVEPGDRFPMVPALSASLGAAYELGSATIGVEATWTGSQFLIGDEGNDEEFPRVGASTVVDIHLEWGFGRSTVFAELANLFDSDYAAFGIVSENGRAATEQVERFLTPGAPRRISAGLRIRLFG